MLLAVLDIGPASDASEEASEGLASPRTIEAPTTAALLAPGTPVCTARGRAEAATDRVDEEPEGDAEGEELQDK